MKKLLMQNIYNIKMRCKYFVNKMIIYICYRCYTYDVAGQSRLFCKRHTHLARNIAKNDLAPHRYEVIFLSFGYLSTYKIHDFRNIFYTTPWRRGCIGESRWRIKKSALYRIIVFAPRHGDIPKTAFWGEKSTFSGEFPGKTAVFSQKQAENPQK